MTTNCTVLGNPYRQPLGNSLVAYVGDPGVHPKVGDVYYTMVEWNTVGLPCGGGGAYVHVEVQLPPDTAFAISDQVPVRCFYDNLDTGTSTEQLTNCPQAAQRGLRGGYAFDPPLEANTNGYWPTPIGRGWHILIPVRSQRSLSGAEGSPCTTCFAAHLQQVDGVDNPWTSPQVGVAIAESVLAPTHYRLDVSADNPGLVVRPAGGTFPAGTEVTLEAKDANGFRFDRWTVDGTLRRDNPLSLVMDRDHVVVAHFVALPTPVAPPPPNEQRLVFVPSVLGANVPLLPPSPPPAEPVPPALVGTWSQQLQYTTRSYRFGSSGSFTYVSAYRFNFNGCTISKSTEKRGTVAVDGATLTLNSAGGTERTSDSCTGNQERSIGRGVERVTWRIEAGAGTRDELVLSDANGEQESWFRMD